MKGGPILVGERIKCCASHFTELAILERQIILHSFSLDTQRLYLQLRSATVLLPEAGGSDAHGTQNSFLTQLLSAISNARLINLLSV